MSAPIITALLSEFPVYRFLQNFQISKNLGFSSN